MGVKSWAQEGEQAQPRACCLRTMKEDSFSISTKSLAAEFLKTEKKLPKPAAKMAQMTAPQVGKPFSNKEMRRDENDRTWMESDAEKWRPTCTVRRSISVPWSVNADADAEANKGIALWS